LTLSQRDKKYETNCLKEQKCFAQALEKTSKNSYKQVTLNTGVVLERRNDVKSKYK